MLGRFGSIARLRRFGATRLDTFVKLGARRPSFSTWPRRERMRKRGTLRGSVRVMSITWTYDAPGLAYISLTDKRPRGLVKTSVDLSDLAADEGVESLHSIVLDFDAEGRLVGIEIPGNAEAVLPRDLLAERGYDENRYRRSN